MESSAALSGEREGREEKEEGGKGRWREEGKSKGGKERRIERGEKEWWLPTSSLPPLRPL